jgi:deazaflavin-dependent oxidoreductase (nitroreductase family)
MVALGYFKDGPDFVVVGSNYGSDLHSIWHLNLRAHPYVEVEIEEHLQNMVASTARVAERPHLCLRLADESKLYGRYQRDTTREIPIVLFHPAEPMPPALVRL